MVSPIIDWHTRKTKAIVNPVNLHDFYKDKGFVFSREILARYALSLKTKPFVILSGISGTGKTKIAQLFADYLLQNETSKEEKDKRLAFVAVRPDWTDNRGLLGYYNLLDERYYATPVLRLLLEAGKEENQGKPYFIILDEMNLARVEHYFSDFLSVMESRTPNQPEGAAIEIHALRGKPVVAAGADDENPPLQIPHAIRIPNNVYFTGTVNVDETTYMFSPKVLDRANVIEFNEVSFSATDTSPNTNFRLTNAEALNWFHDPQARFCSKADFDQAKKTSDFLQVMEELKTRLYPHHLHFGYRVAQEMARFVNLSREYIDEAQSLQAALDIQLLQKVLPKFHGTQGKLEKPLEALKEFCKEQGYERSVAKLDRMLDDLKNQGYCSFIA